jgi:hypothetical protein
MYSGIIPPGLHKDRTSSFSFSYSIRQNKTVQAVTNLSHEVSVFWDVTPCGSCKNQLFGGTDSLRHMGGKIQQARTISKTASVV